MPAFKRNTFNIPVSPGATGIADIANILLGNSDPGGMIALKGQSMGADLANKIASGRQTGLENEKLAIGLENMKFLQNLFPQGSLEHQAVIDPLFPGGQLGLGRAAKNAAEQQARERLEASGATVSIGGKDIPLAFLNELMSGPDASAFAKILPEIADIRNKTSTRQQRADATVEEKGSSAFLNVARADTEFERQEKLRAETGGISQKTGNEEKEAANKLKMAEEKFKEQAFKTKTAGEDFKKTQLEVAELAEKLVFDRNMAPFKKMELQAKIYETLGKISGSGGKGSNKLSPDAAIRAYTVMAQLVGQSFEGLRRTTEANVEITDQIFSGLAESGNLQKMIDTFEENPKTDPTDFISDARKKIIEDITNQLVFENKQEEVSADDIMNGLGLPVQGAQGQPAPSNSATDDILSNLGIAGNQEPQVPAQKQVLLPPPTVTPAPAPVPAPAQAPVAPQGRLNSKEIVDKYSASLSKVFPPNVIDIIAKGVSSGDFERLEEIVAILKSEGQEEQAAALAAVIDDNFAFLLGNK